MRSTAIFLLTLISRRCHRRPQEGRSVTTDEYLYDTEETNRICELAMGRVREPPAPFFSHQTVALKVARSIADYTEPRFLGRVAMAPVDVILDRERALVLQPDVLFVATSRLAIVRDQVWGPPDLVVEVLSPGTEHRDRTEKLGWYRQYGVRECWLVDVRQELVTVVDFTGALPVERAARGAEAIQSSVLPGLEVTAAVIFA
jgi:Uma2 family endonuclease